MPLMMSDFYAGAQGAIQLQQQRAQFQAFQQAQSELQKFYSQPQPVEDTTVEDPGQSALKESQQFTKLAQIYSRYDPRQAKEYMDMAKERQSMFLQYQKDTNTDMARTLNSVQDQQSLNTAWDMLHREHPQEAKRLLNQYPELAQWSPATRSRLAVVVANMDRDGKVAALTEKQREFQDREQRLREQHQDSLAMQADRRERREQTIQDKKDRFKERKETQLQKSYQVEIDKLDSAERSVNTQWQLTPQQKEEEKRKIANKRRELDRRFRTMGFDPTTMSYTPPAEKGKSAQIPITENPKALEIKQKLVSGQITKEEAIKQLKALGY